MASREPTTNAIKITLNSETGKNTKTIKKVYKLAPYIPYAVTKNGHNQSTPSQQKKKRNKNKNIHPITYLSVRS